MRPIVIWADIRVIRVETNKLKKKWMNVFFMITDFREGVDSHLDPRLPPRRTRLESCWGINIEGESEENKINQTSKSCELCHTVKSRKTVPKEPLNQGKWSRKKSMYDWSGARGPIKTLKLLKIINNWNQPKIKQRRETTHRKGIGEIGDNGKKEGQVGDALRFAALEVHDDLRQTRAQVEHGRQ